MAVFGLVFVVFAVSMAALAVGVLSGRAPLKGTCASGTCANAFKCGGCQNAKLEGGKS